MIWIMENQKSEWFHKYSENLKQNVAFNRITGWVHCEDGTTYSPEENSILKKSGQQIPLQVHLIKKVFGGTLIPT